MDKSQNLRKKYLSGSSKENKNYNVLKTKFIKKISVNLNNIKPGVFNLYKRSSLNYKYNNQNIKKNSKSKKTSFSNYKNYSIITSNSNIYKKIFVSNSNSPINKIRNIKNDNTSDIFNLRKNRSKKFELKKKAQ